MMRKVVLTASHVELRKIIGDATGVQPTLPVIITDQGVLDQFVGFLYDKRSMSSSWHKEATFAVRLLLEYMTANHDYFDKPSKLFIAFSNSLRTGTINQYQDPSGLWWEARDIKASSKIINYITQFSDWLTSELGGINHHLNPWKDANRHEQRILWAAYSHRCDNAFLSHLWKDEKFNYRSRLVKPKGLVIENIVPAKAFPEEHIDVLLEQGFKLRPYCFGAVDMRRVLITLLMHYGGLRLSETLGLWCDDVSVENGQVIVRVYHPENGIAPDGGSNRTSYLESKFGLIPRNMYPKDDPRYLGWKDPLLTDNARSCFEVFFFPSVAENEFIALWQAYHTKQRVRPKLGYEHPYAFTTQDGMPYTHSLFRKAHAAAVERIGLKSRQIMGTAPHSHRHAFGLRLANAGADPTRIRLAMHHKSEESSKVYTQPSASQFREEFKRMESRIEMKFKPGLEVVKS